MQNLSIYNFFYLFFTLTHRSTTLPLSYHAGIRCHFLSQHGLEQYQSKLPLSKVTSFPAPVWDPFSSLWGDPGESPWSNQQFKIFPRIPPTSHQTVQASHGLQLCRHHQSIILFIPPLPWQPRYSWRSKVKAHVWDNHNQRWELKGLSHQTQARPTFQTLNKCYGFSVFAWDICF
jgi:hypothetical protein